MNYVPVLVKYLQTFIQNLFEAVKASHISGSSFGAKIG